MGSMVGTLKSTRSSARSGDRGQRGKKRKRLLGLMKKFESFGVTTPAPGAPANKASSHGLAPRVVGQQNLCDG